MCKKKKITVFVYNSIIIVYIVSICVVGTMYIIVYIIMFALSFFC